MSTGGGISAVLNEGVTVPATLYSDFKLNTVKTTNRNNSNNSNN